MNAGPAAIPHVVVVGAGFAGLYAARALGGRAVRVTVVDRRNHHLFQPLLYQVATAALSPGDIAAPVRSILRRYPNVHVHLGEVSGIDLPGRRILLRDGSSAPSVDSPRPLAYDYLIVATGASHSYFGRDDWAAHAPGLKTIEDALEIRRRVLAAYEAAEIAVDPAQRRALMTFVVVGGGPTGVELAGAIAEIARQTLRRDFRAIDPAESRVLLLEGGPRILPAFPKALSESAAHQLAGLGVEVRTDARVTDITPDAVHVGEEAIPTHCALWAAGVAASALGRDLGQPLDRAGRVTVNPDLTLPGHPEVYVLGDMALFPHQSGAPLPGIAPVAIQQGQTAAENVWRTVRGLPRRPFHYVDRGLLATIGRAAAVGQVRGVNLTGVTAWLAWLVVHIYYLIGFENRLLVFLQWAWAYFTYQRGARLITGPPGSPGMPPPRPSDPPTVPRVGIADATVRVDSRGSPAPNR